MHRTSVLRPTRPLALALAVASVAACGSQQEDADSAGGAAATTPRVRVVLDGLNNPSGVAFSPDGRLTVCDAGLGREHGNGRVLTSGLDGGERSEFLTGFPTEYWKRGADGEPDRFKLGPLSAVWLDADRVVVTNCGLADGVDHLVLFSGSGDASTGAPSNAIGPTSGDSADKGEGNFTGLSVGDDGTVYVAGQGADAKTWVLAYDAESAELAGLASADDYGIAINSPMATLPWGGDSLLVLYSGAGGVEDGTIVQWNLESGEPTAQWSLPGIFDPMGFAAVGDSTDLVVVDNNWNLREVNDGRLARVQLPDGGGEAEVEVLLDDLKGPTSCAFGPDGNLYVSLLGPVFDADRGSVVSISGL